MTFCTVNCTTANEQEAKKIAKHLIDKKLIACASIIPNIHSVYVWKNKLNEDSECFMIMKTKTEFYSEIEEEIKKMHSYEVPEIICIPIIAGSKEYLNWIEDWTT